MGLAVNLGTLWVLVHGAGWPYLMAGGAAIQLSMIHNFIWHDRWTFRHRDTDMRWLGRLGRFELAMAVGMTLSWLTLAALVEWARVPLLLAQAGGSVVGAFVNFTMCKLWAWKQRRPSTSHITGSM